MKKGDVMGHEFMGVVEDVGPQVQGLKKGDRVVSAFDMGCSRCFFCKKVRKFLPDDAALAAARALLYSLS